MKYEWFNDPKDQNEDKDGPPVASPPVFDPSDYEDEWAGTDVDPEALKECLAVLWNIAAMFARMGYKGDISQIILGLAGQNTGEAPERLLEVDCTEDFNHRGDGGSSEHHAQTVEESEKV